MIIKKECEHFLYRDDDTGEFVTGVCSLMCMNDDYDHEGNYAVYPCPLQKEKCCFRVESMGSEVCWPQPVDSQSEIEV